MNLVEAVNEHSTLKLQRDVMGRVVQEWQNGYTVSSKYDRNGRRNKLQSSLGADIQLQRNATGDVTDIQAQATGSHNPWTAHIERNLLGLEIERTLPGGVKSSWSYDKAGMPESHAVSSGQRSTRRRHYRWDANQRLKQIINRVSSGTVKFGHDDFGNLAWAQYEDGEYDYRLPDKAGNLYKTQGRKDRKYGPGGKLLETADARFIYDEEGNLIKKVVTADPPAGGGATWEYEWYGSGMLKKVVRPDGKNVEFRYDPLGRRIEKQYNGQLTLFVWDGNVPLHEWSYPAQERPVVTIDELGDVQQDHPEPVPAETLATWVFEEGTFAPAAKIVNGKQYSIITDHLGTPCEAYDEAGEKVWECELDIYGKVRKLAGDKSLIPFRYQGQYEDEETGLYYNRFRYYSPEEGVYVSQDLIGLGGGIKFYSYVIDPLKQLDTLGLSGIEWVDPNLINFTQRTISPNDYAEAMKAGQWDWEQSPLKVLEIDGQLVSYDNRRLDAAQEAGLKKVGITRLDPDAIEEVEGVKKTWGERFIKRMNDRRNIKRGEKAPKAGWKQRPKCN